jgi:hypothetical protein
MFDKKELCQKIIELYPDLGACEIDVDAFYSTAKGTWVVELKKGDHILQHHLEKHDALDCIDGKQWELKSLNSKKTLKQNNFYYNCQTPRLWLANL